MNELKKKKILIIEDQAGFRLIYRGVLESDGYEVLEAASGQRGWELAKEETPDMILLDLILPDLSGYEVLKKIRDNENTKDIPIIIFSVLGSGKDIRKGLELGANDYRIKGDSSPTIILEKIRTLLSNDK